MKSRSIVEEIVKRFLDDVQAQMSTGIATEHSYRKAIQDLFHSLSSDIRVINEPQASEYGRPDFRILDIENHDLNLGYGEAKNISESLSHHEMSEQMIRYKGYSNLFLTNNIEWRFYRNGTLRFSITIAELSQSADRITAYHTDSFQMLADEIYEFLSQPPEKITSAVRLANIMGAKARRARDYINNFEFESDEIQQIFLNMQDLLIHDLDKAQFSDMYAQTLVYGLFAARYNDRENLTFTRQTARDLVPKTNPFLRHFFDHIAGVNFVDSLSFIVDELCAVFQVSDIRDIIHEHYQMSLMPMASDKDPILHFYEDFLTDYDPEMRKRVGAYYTPLPVVRYIVNSVNTLLIEEFGIKDGLASDEKINSEIISASGTCHVKEAYRVQILDPALGTGTFLNEVIQHVYYSHFHGQYDLWPIYVNDVLIDRLFGFEMMMAPYTIAHMKLGITLAELGASNVDKRLGVYLTNTLEEGHVAPDSLLGFAGISQAISEESKEAANIKVNAPIMVMIGNPPYSISSVNKNPFIQELISVYKEGLNERKINLDDDYIKFIRFSEHMIEKNGTGIMAMITNNSYIDGITHRNMRKHLLKTFDSIYIIDLHGSTVKKEKAPDGSPDQNVFDIMQGVSIILAAKTGAGNSLGKVYHSELFGNRSHKFNSLESGNISFVELAPAEPNFFFVPTSDLNYEDYSKGIHIDDLFFIRSSGFRSGDDSSQIAWSRDQIVNVVTDLIHLSEQEYRNKYSLKDGRNHNYKGMKADVGGKVEPDRVIPILYRPFDQRWTYYSIKSSGFTARPRNKVMNNFVKGDNLGLVLTRQPMASNIEHFDSVFITECVADENLVRRGSSQVFPLYLYRDDGSIDSNLNPLPLKELLQNISTTPTEVQVFDYIYGVLHSPSFRHKYWEFIKNDFPRIPIPSTDGDFKRICTYGSQLRQLHLGLADAPPISNFHITGTNTVTDIRRVDNKVYFNESQFFDNVDDLIWSFSVGGYKPALKWLKDRKGRELAFSDIRHYQQIVATISETLRIMDEIG